MLRIIRRELRANMKSLLIWSVSVIVIIALMMSEFAAYYDNPDMAAIMDSLPQPIMDAFSLNADNLTTVIGFTAMASMYLLIAVGLFGALQGANILAKEERDKTAEFFYTLPVSREVVITSKLIASTINCVLLSTFTSLGLVITSLPYEIEPNYWTFIALLTVAMSLLSVIFMSMGMMMASILKRYKLSGNITIFIVMVSYLMTIFMDLSDKLSFFKHITPFNYVDVHYIVRNNHLHPSYSLVGIGLIVVMTAVTYLTYPKRDLHL